MKTVRSNSLFCAKHDVFLNTERRVGVNSLHRSLAQAGRSMLEMLCVLAIIGVLIMVGISSFSKAMTMYHTDKMMDQLTMLVTNIRTMFSQEHYYTNLNNAQAIELGVVPEGLLLLNTGVLQNPFKGYVYINPTDPLPTTTDKNAAFEITYTGLSRESCILIATSDWGSGSQSGLVSIMFRANGTDATAENASQISLEYRQIGCSGYVKVLGDGDGEVVACPDGNVHVPLTIAQANIACNCAHTRANRCAISWMYF